MRIHPIIIHCLLGLGLLSFTVLAQTDDDDETELPGTIDGGWRWNFTMPDGTTVRPRLGLSTEDNKLAGTISFRPGTEVPITNAVLNGDRLRFQVIRQREGQTILTTYSGVWSGRTIRGQIKSNWAGQEQTFDWEAQRAHAGVEGVWTWANPFPTKAQRAGGAPRSGRLAPEFPTRVLLQQDGEKVTGRTVPRFGRPVRLANGSITNSEVSFEIERTVREVKSVIRFKGKQTGDAIAGTIEIDTDGRTRKANWDAKRRD